MDKQHVIHLSCTVNNRRRINQSSIHIFIALFNGTAGACPGVGTTPSSRFFFIGIFVSLYATQIGGGDYYHAVYKVISIHIGFQYSIDTLNFRVTLFTPKLQWNYYGYHLWIRIGWATSLSRKSEPFHYKLYFKNCKIWNYVEIIN